jgi:hypothetical protein
MRRSKSIIRIPHFCRRIFKASVGIFIPSTLSVSSQSFRCSFRVYCAPSLPGIGASIEGNPHPGAIGSDFNRLGVDIWTDVYALDARNERRRESLQELIDWRNAIAHQDFDPVVPGGIPTLHLARVRAWRSAVNALVRAFDQAMYNYLQGVVGSAPW